jgi:hypothetical protein
MASTIPSVIAWPIVIFMTLVVAMRYRWCNTNLYDTYFNNTLAFLLITQFLRERKIEDLLSKNPPMTVTAARQFSFAAMIFAATEFIGFTMLWMRHSSIETCRRHRYYRLAAVILCAAYLAAATRARVAGQTLEVSGGWDGILAWSLLLTMWFVMSGQVIRMCVSELNKITQAPEFLVAIGGLLLGAVSLTVCLEALVLAVTDQLGWTNTVEFRLWFHGFDFDYEAIIAFMIGGVPIAAKLLFYLGLDSTSRNWNRLQPLLLSMTTVVPESIFNPDHDDHRSRKTILQLHQVVIAIRDAILRLRPYFRDIAPHELTLFLKEYSVPARNHNAASHAFQLAHAARAKAAGATPAPTDMNLVVRSRSTTLNDEVTELLKLAKWWTPAYAATEKFTPDPKAKASA